MHLKFWNNIQLSDNLSIFNKLILCISEFFGTLILMFVGCLSCVNHNYEVSRQLVESAFGFGFAVLIAIQCFGHISGAHINPVITLTAVIRGKLPLIEVPFYLIGQFLGSIAGFGLLKIVIPEHFIYGKMNVDEGICAAGLLPELSVVQGVFIEAFITFILSTLACGVWDHRNSTSDSVPLIFGFAVAVLVFAAGPFTAAHMNPARTFGPALLNGYWKHNWIFWVGPICGSMLASILYSIVYN